jgi:hypothetical protein
VNRAAALTLLLSLPCLASVGCKREETTTPEPIAATPSDPIDAAAELLLAKLAEQDYAGLEAACVDPLTRDLTQAEFEDLAKIVAWLGPVRERSITATDMDYGGGQRWYRLAFAQGRPLDLEVSIDPNGKLIGFAFAGPGWIDGEHGVIAEQWREFKIYDFAYVDGEGQRLPEGAAIPGTRVEYVLVVGGIEAFLGEHHLVVEKVVVDASGAEVFREPIEYDVKFRADSMGIPRGTVGGYLDLPGPGRWDMRLVITDQHSGRKLDYRHPFETVAAP